jgi:creatinine amidohydrolase
MTNKKSKDSALKGRFGPIALITGASDGIGRAFAVELAEHGFDLILVARRDAVLQELALDLGTRFGVNVRAVAVDLSDPGAVPQLMSLTDSTHVGLVVAAAGFGSIGPFLDQDVASEINMVDLNCRSVVELSYGFGQRMAAQKRGGIVLFGSLVGFNGAPLSATYAATKGFVQSFAEGIAAEIGALVAPPFTYGYKSHQKSGGGNHLPGTTSLDGATLVAALKDVVKEFARHGVRKICLVNGHFENSWFIVEGIDLALRELRWDGITDLRVVVLSYWDLVHKEAIARLYPGGFPGWDVEHGGVLETSLMLALHPEHVHLDRAGDHAPATFPPYDVYPVRPERTPPSGTLSSPKEASVEKGHILLDVCTSGIVAALRAEFG